jgi:hypothetical protein
VASSIYKANDTKYRCMLFFGMIEDGKKGEKLSFKHSLVNQKDKTEINYNKSEHTKAMQKSKYLSVDEKLDKSYYLGVNTLRKVDDTQKNQSASDNVMRVGLRFCKTVEVNKKRQKLLNLQTQYAF